MALSTGIVVLDGCGDYPAWTLVEVYDHAQPPLQVEVLEVEALAAGVIGIVHAIVGTSHGQEDGVDVVQEPWSSPGQMQVRSGVEDDIASVRIDCTGSLLHGR
jgi:hypothetical protein